MRKCPQRPAPTCCSRRRVEEIYPPGQATIVRMGGPADGHEGAHRPGHFDGVATVCLILFNMVQPHVAVFGQKDAQQVAVIQQLVRDLALPLEIAVHPTLPRSRRPGDVVSQRPALSR